MLNDYLKLDGIADFKDFCLKEGRILNIKKNDFFVRQNERSMFAGYVEEGGFRYIRYTTAGKKQVVGYSFKDDFVTDYGAFQNQTQAVVFIQAIKESSVHVITREEFNHFCDHHNDKYFRCEIAESLFTDVYDRFLSLHCDTSEERYFNIATQHPELLNAVSLKEIASYIGVTPETLSRIRKNINYVNA